MGTVAKVLGVYPAPPPPPDFRDPGLHFDFLAKTLNFAISPRNPRHALSVASGSDDKGSPWEWIYERVRPGANDPEWSHRDSADGIRLISAQFSH